MNGAPTYAGSPTRAIREIQQTPYRLGHFTFSSASEPPGITMVDLGDKDDPSSIERTREPAWLFDKSKAEAVSEAPGRATLGI